MQKGLKRPLLTQSLANTSGSEIPSVNAVERILRATVAISGVGGTLQRGMTLKTVLDYAGHATTHGNTKRITSIKIG